MDVTSKFGLKMAFIGKSKQKSCIELIKSNLVQLRIIP